MERYIGLDAHSRSCTFAVMGPSGRRIAEATLETDATTLRRFVQEIPRRRHLCLEEGALSEWLFELLEPIVDEIVVVQPERTTGNKNDAIDAWKRADELRRGAISRPVYKSPGQFRALRAAVRAYQFHLNDVVRVKNRLNALYRSRGITGSNGEIYEPTKRNEWLQRLPMPTRRLAELFGDELDDLNVHKNEAEAWLREEAARTPIVHRLSTAPGIGVVRASQIVATVICPQRFRTKRQFWSYCGLGIVTHSSSDWQKNRFGKWERREVGQTRGLNRNRNPILKAAFKGAAVHVIGCWPEHPLSQSYQRMLEHTKPNLARLTLARRIAAATLAMWKNQEDYKPDKHQAPTV